mgnify:CR=1 FL=1
MIKIFVILCVTRFDAEIVMSTGIVLEPAGMLYKSRGHNHYTVVVNRPSPYSQLQTIEFNGCYCKTNSKIIKRETEEDYLSAKTGKPCNGETKDRFLTTFNTQFNNTMEQLESTTDVGHREKRADSWFSYIANGISFIWNGFKEYDIYNLKQAELASGRSITMIAEALNETINGIEVQHNQIYEDLSNIGNEICANAYNTWSEVMTTRAEMVTRRYLSEIEDEAVSLSEGRLPARIEFENIFLGVCQNSCNKIGETLCRHYCHNVVQDIPTEMLPTLIGLNRHQMGVKIIFSITLPVLVATPIPAYHVTSFGTITSAGNDTYKKIPVVKPYAAEYENEVVEVYGTECRFGKELLICPQNALKTESCLNEQSRCTYDWIKTDDDCTYAYTINGVAIYKRANQTGLNFIQNGNTEQVIMCSNKQQIIVPVKMANQNVTIEIETGEFQIADFDDLPVEITMDSMKTNFTNQLQIIQNNQKKSNKYVNTKIWIFVAGAAVMFVGGAIAMFALMMRFKGATQAIQDELNLRRMSI